MSNKFAVSSEPIMPVLEKRWSPRAFDKNHTLAKDDLTPALEAARWAPSAGNSQPSRFVVSLRESDGFAAILDNLNSANAHWAKNASALIVNIAEVHDDEGRMRRWAEYDLGQAVAHFSVQAHADGLFVHQMGGFDGPGIELALGLPEARRVVTVMAVGMLADPETVDLADHHMKQELSSRSRLDLADLTTFV